MHNKCLKSIRPNHSDISPKKMAVARTFQTRSSADAEGPRDAFCHS